MEQIEQRKEKAAELSSGRHANTDYAPKLTPYERKKQCSLCNVMVSQRGCCQSCKASLSPAAMNGASFTDKSIVCVLCPCAFVKCTLLELLLSINKVV